MTRRQRRTFTAEFKLQLVKIYDSRKSHSDIEREYDITPSALDRWIKNNKDIGSFKASDNRSQKDNELDELRKVNQRLIMETDILKQATLIMRRK